MPTTFLLLLILVFVLFFVSKRIQESANQYLDQAQKAGLVDLFSSLRTKYPALIITLLVAFFANQYFNLIPDGVALSYKILIDNDYPRPYVKSFIQATIVRIGALVMLIVALTSF